jgi:hypothetical protein
LHQQCDLLPCKHKEQRHETPSWGPPPGPGSHLWVMKQL